MHVMPIKNFDFIPYFFVFRNLPVQFNIVELRFHVCYRLCVRGFGLSVLACDLLPRQGATAQSMTRDLKKGSGNLRRRPALWAGLRLENPWPISSKI
jgi:hypothetical protein